MDLIDTFPETDDDYVPTPACDAGDACQDSLCADHGAEVQANLRATASMSWVGVIALAREIVRTQDAADRYVCGHELPVEPLEPGDLARPLAKLWRWPVPIDKHLWHDFTDGLLVGLGYDDGLPDDAAHEGTDEQQRAWYAGRRWAFVWLRAARKPNMERLPWDQPCDTSHYENSSLNGYTVSADGRVISDRGDR